MPRRRAPLSRLPLLALPPLMALAGGLAGADAVAGAVADAPTAAADGDPGAVSVSVANEHVAVGASLPVVVDYRWRDGWQPLDGPSPAADFAGAAVLSLAPAADSASGGMHHRRVQLALRADRSGAWLLPEVHLALISDAGERRLLTAHAVVALVGEAPGERVAPTALIVPADRRWRWWTCLPALATIVGAAWWWQAARRRRLVQLAASPERRLVAALADAGSLADGKSAGAALALALRCFAGALWGFDGPAATSDEASRLVARRATAEEAAVFARLLGELDDRRWHQAALEPASIAPLIAGGQAWGRRVAERLRAEAAAVRGPAGASTRPAVQAPR